MKAVWRMIMMKVKHLFRLNDDAESEEEVISGIRAGVEFRGARLWILIIAVFVASLGLNTNSAAVIIGAMLISPLMGPIIGIGLGLGIYDFELLRKSVRNYVVTALFSIVTATIYFLISPYSEARSELLARTAPTIYDVLIALCGGMAGIIALGSKSQKWGNVIPGVAIATALMPPLCTVGYGISTGIWSYAAGALYLFVINTIFIVVATFIGSTFIMHFRKRTFVDRAKEVRVRRISTSIIVATIIPSVILTVGMVRNSYFDQKVNRFIQQELYFPKTHIVSYKSDYNKKTFDVVMIGAVVDSLQLRVAQEKMPFYGLEDVEMQVVQASLDADESDMMEKLRTDRVAIRHDEEIIVGQQKQIAELEERLSRYSRAETMSGEVYDELRLLYPQVEEVLIAKGMTTRGGAEAEKKTVEQVVALLIISSDMNEEESERMKNWLILRSRIDDLRVEIMRR